jgi:hypothetical protein
LIIVKELRAGQTREKGKNPQVCPEIKLETKLKFPAYLPRVFKNWQTAYAIPSPTYRMASPWVSITSKGENSFYL